MTAIASLSGDFDVTIPLWDVSKYATGDQPAEWLMTSGRPRFLRSDGWVYIRTEAQIVGRVRAIGIGDLEVRPERTGSPPGVRGPGPVVFVNPATWDTSIQYDLSVDRRFYGQGIRYVATSDVGSIRHWNATKSVYYGSPVRPGSTSPVLENLDQVPNPHIATGDEAGADGWMVEGATQLTQVVSYERNRKARERCLREYGYNCAACGMNFADRYGEIGDGFIHVHHLRAISSIGAEYVIDPISDLRPLCPNCHAMVHRRTPALTIEELREVLHARDAGEDEPRS